MTPEERSILHKVESLSEENNSMLHSMQRSQRISTFLTIFYWFLILGGSVGIFYFLQPIVDKISKSYSGASSDYQSFKDGVDKFKNATGLGK